MLSFCLSCVMLCIDNFNNGIGATSAAACDTPHAIYSASLNLFVCASSESLLSTLTLKSDPFVDLSTCWWFENAGKRYLSGSKGLLMDAQDADECAGSSFILNTDFNSSSQIFYWAKVNSGFSLVNAGGIGQCAMQSTANSVISAPSNNGDSQRYVRWRLSCSSTPGSYWDQDLNNPSCSRCETGLIFNNAFCLLGYF
jgi:hypothetical protein